MSVRKKYKKLEDFDITHRFLALEAEIYDVLKNVPREFNFDLKQQTKDFLGFVKLKLAKSITLVPFDQEMWQAKRTLLNDVYSDMTAVTLTLIQLNNRGVIKNEVKSDLDIKISGLLQDMRSLLSTFSGKVKGSDSAGCAPAADAQMIKTHNCDGSGGDHA